MGRERRFITTNDSQKLYIYFEMTEILENIKNEVTQSRKYCYAGKYAQALSHFSLAIQILTGHIPTIKDPALIKQWNRLLQQIKSEKEMANSMKQILQGNFDAPVNKRERVSYKDDAHQRQVQLFKQKSTNQYPDYNPSHEPSFKKRSAHQDDELYNKREKQLNLNQRDKESQRERQQRQKEFQQRDAQIWPKKKPANMKKAQSKNNTYSNPTPVADNKSGVKGREYSKPWLNNVKGKQQQKKTFLKSCYPDGQGPDATLIEMLEKQVVNLSPNTSFDDIAQLQKAKELLEEAVLLPLLMPNLFTGIRRAWKGVLLFGPPGTGKTLLAKAIASGGKTTFFNVTSSTLASKWKGDSQKLVRILFQMAKFYAPTTIFFDEIDAIASKRGDKQDQSSRKVKTELMARIDGVSSGQQGKSIVVIGATNRPWDIDQAILRRLQKRIYIPLPTQIGRREMFKINLKSQKVDGVDFEELVKRSDGFSGADINNLCRDAAFVQMRKKIKKQGGIGKKVINTEWAKQFEKEVSGPLTMQDFNEALKNVKSSVGKEHLAKYQKWMAQFGQQGTQ